MERYDKNFKVDMYLTADTAYCYDNYLWELRGRVFVCERTKGITYSSEQLYWDTRNHRLYSRTYMHIVGGFGFFQAISFTISAVLRAANKPNYAMEVTLLINLLNIFGNYSLIFGHFGFPALGVQGAAISTSLCRGVAMTLLFLMLFKRLVRHFP